MTGYDAYQVFAHLRDTGTIQAAGELLGAAFAKGLAAETAKLDKESVAAAQLADALEAYVADGDISIESFDRAAEEFRRDTGFLAPGKDEAATVNSGVTHEERSHAWNIWVGKRRRTQHENALAALRAAGRLP